MEAFKVLKEISGVPSEFQLLPFGRIEIEKGDWAVLDDESMNLVNRDFVRRGNDMVIDYEHQTLNGGNAPAAGWIKKLINRGIDGLWAVVEWTEQAKRYLINREYRYYSPVMMVRKDDRKIVQIINAALTNAPRINRLKPIVAKRGGTFINETQRRINKMVGITDEEFLTYNCKEPVKETSKEADLEKIERLLGLRQ